MLDQLLLIMCTIPVALFALAVYNHVKHHAALKRHYPGKEYPSIEATPGHFMDKAIISYLITILISSFLLMMFLLY